MRRASAIAALSRLVRVLAIILLLSLSACRHQPKVLVLAPDSPLAHDIGTWLDSDLICVGLPGREALYVQRRCVPMRTIRTLILQTRSADGGMQGTFTKVQH